MVRCPHSLQELSHQGGPNCCQTVRYSEVHEPTFGLWGSRSARDQIVWPRRISVVEDDAQQRAVDFERQIAVVLDEAELLEFIQKEIHPRARRADHVGERFL